MSPKQKITAESFQLFASYGIKSITMDDIARHLSISKKTLYENFEDKDDLVYEAICFKIELVQADMLKTQKEASDAIDELIRASEYVSKMLKGMNPAAIMDMRKYHPKAWEAFHHHQKVFFMKMVQDNLAAGVKQGLYRQGMDLQIVALKRMYEVDMCMQPDKFPIDEFNMDKVQLQIMDLFMHGISTLKGHKLINKYKKIKEED
jgi:predicted DNA-binding protein YlxM (UPF0122 family)